MDDHQGLDHRGDRDVERTLWFATYLALVLAPLALMAVTHLSGGRSLGVELAAGLGFLGLALLALQMVMPSRARAFTAPFGIDVLLRFHRQVGMVALVLVLAHVGVLIVDDPSRLSLLDPVTAPWRAMAGTASVLALLLLIASSAWRRDLGLSYERWRALHIVLGVAVVGFAFAHLVGVGKYLAVGTIRWASLLFVIVAACALFYLRVGRPLVGSRRRYRVREVRPERGGATTVALEADDHAGVRFRPGQFAWVKLADAPYSLSEHPFSFSSSAARPHNPEFTIKALGDFTARVPRLSIGSPVVLDGPHGSFQPDTGESYLLIAGGIGITPIISILRTLADVGDSRRVVLIYANRGWDGATFREELDRLRSRLALDIVHVLSKPPEGWTGETGRVDERLLGRALPLESRGWQVFICGPAAMTQSALKALAAVGVPRRKIHAEEFLSA